MEDSTNQNTDNIDNNNSNLPATEEQAPENAQENAYTTDNSQIADQPETQDSTQSTNINTINTILTTTAKIDPATKAADDKETKEMSDFASMLNQNVTSLLAEAKNKLNK